MIKTSAAYQAAIVGSPRRIELLTVVDISDPDMAYGEVTSSGLAPWSKPEELHDKSYDTPARYATLERGRWLLDGTFDIFPDDFKVEAPMAVATEAISGDDGTFQEPVWVQQSFSDVDVLQACSVFFSTDPLDGVPADFTVEIITAGQAFHTERFTGNTATEVAVTGFTVQTPDAIKVTVSKWSLPGRRMRVVEILPGTVERWAPRMLASFSVVQQGDFSCLALPYGSMSLAMDNKDRRFEPRSKNGLFQSIEERQGIDAFIGVRTESGAVVRCKVGRFYQSGDGWKTGDNSLTMQWSLVDIIGLLTDRTFLPSSPLPTTLGGWIGALAAQLGVNFKGRWHVDPNYTALPVTVRTAADIQGKKCGDILRWVCQATGTWPRADASTGDLTAEPLWREGNKVTLDNLTAYPTMKANDQLASLIFKLADGNDTEYVVSGNSTSSEKTVTIQNPFLHTTAQALAAARLILSCYGGNVIETTGRGDPSSEIGDVDTIWLDESQATTARRMMQNFQIQGGVLQGCQSKLLQADGSYLYSRSVVLTESGTWTAPAGVTHLRVAVGQGGQGGGYGEDGYVYGSGWMPGQGVAAGYGEDGENGIGGKVWYDSLTINAGQTFAVHIGKGGAAATRKGAAGAEGEESTFGVYSSANGKRYANGYTDINSGDSYARTGVAKPLPGTGDGAAGGKGGDPGQGYWKKYTVRPNPAKPDVVNTSYKFIITKQPGPGHPGKPGGDGFVLIAWDKAEETA